MFLCQLTGTVVKQPVVTRDGHIYEKAILLRFLKEHDYRDPKDHTKKLDPALDLVEIKEEACVNKPSSAFSGGDVTNVLEILQSKFDELMIEMHDIRKERDEARQQVTHLLYLRDSATQIIAKHIEEKELLKAQLEEARSDLKKRARETTEGDERQPNLRRRTDDTVAKIESAAAKLMETRKQRKIVCRDYTAYSQYKKFTYKAQDTDNVTCSANVLSRQVVNASRRIPGMVALGHSNHEVSIHLLPEELEEETKLLAKAEGHDAPITCLASLVYPTDLAAGVLGILGAKSDSCQPFESCLNILSGSADGTVRHWKDVAFTNIEQDWLDPDSHILSKSPDSITQLRCQHVYKPHLGELSSIKLHPLGYLVAFTGQADQIQLFDLTSNVNTMTLKSLASLCPGNVTGVDFQPDGNLAVGLQSSAMPIWDIRTQAIETHIKVEQPKSLSFSQNGYHLAVVTEDQLTIWDLRKLAPLTTTPVTGSITQCTFDNSGKNVAVQTKEGLNIVSAVEKKKYEIVATWSQTHLCQTAFDHLTDDYILTVASTGELTSYNAF